MRHIFASLACSIALASAPLMAETSIHKWVDANGVTHFGAEPPKNVKSQEVKPLIYSSGTTTAPAPEAAPEAKPEDPTKKDAAAEKPKENILTISAEQIAAQCQNAQSRLQQLEASPRLMTQTPDGQMQRVPEEERQKMMDDERARIKEYCE
ncbi:MAG: DUF4124 domain-containing protein [Halothiobacillaceae bacterium]|nr:DUF4124 domain-containing protein [Halothiobacillaceae bacterium]